MKNLRSSCQHQLLGSFVPAVYYWHHSCLGGPLNLSARNVGRLEGRKTSGECGNRVVNDRDRTKMALSKREYEDFKSAADKMVHKYVGRDYAKVLSAVLHGVDSGLEKRKLEDKLMGYVDKSLAYKITDKTYQILSDLGIKTKSTSSRKRSHKEEDVREKESKRAKVKEDKSEKVSSQPITPLPENVKPGIPPPSLVKPSLTTTISPGQIQAQQIKDIMAKAQATIEERKKALASIHSQQKPIIPNGAMLANLGHAAAGLGGGGGGGGAGGGDDVTSRIAQLQARIQAQLGNTGIVPAEIPITKPPAEVSKPTPLILDDEGRTVDQSGKEVHLTQRIPTLKANIRAKKREEFKQQLQEKPLEDSLEGKFHDNRVSIRPFSRVKRGFKFHDPGKFIQIAQRERAKARLEKLQSQILATAKKTGISSAAKLAQLEQKDVKVAADTTPIVEWWDEVILLNDTYPDDDKDIRVKEEYITSLVEHPLEMRCPADPTKPIMLPVFLTKKERKKLRRMNRREAWKEKQEKIRLGLEPPPEPKVRMANLMRVLGTEAVLDPTKMEKHVREQMEKRLKAHEDANAARKLTPEQRREKKLRKLKEDTDTGVHVSVYRVTDLTNGSHKFKVETNAKQLFLTGTVVLYKDVNVIVVEGGPKQQKKFRRLMLDRIKWSEESRNKDADVENKCQLIWDGIVPDRNFGEMQFKSCPTEQFARDYFKKCRVEHYWDLAYGKKILEETDDAL